MPAERWRGKVQVGVETTPGTPVPTTRTMYLTNPMLSSEQEIIAHEFATGTRDQVRSVSQGAVVAAGQIALPLSYDEILELLLMSVSDTPVVTASQIAAVTADNTVDWVFKPTNDVKSATVEWHDGINVWQSTGTKINQLTIAGNVRQENAVTADLFATNLAKIAGLTAISSSRTPTVINGWESKLYLDPFGSAAGVTNIPGTLVNWSVRFGNNLEREYTADNTRAAFGVNIGTMSLDGATFLFRGGAAQSVTENTNFLAATKRTLRLEFGNNNILETKTAQDFKGLIWIDIPGVWTARDLGQDNAGARAYQFTYRYVYDPVMAAGLRITVRTLRKATVTNPPWAA